MRLFNFCLAIIIDILVGWLLNSNEAQPACLPPVRSYHCQIATKVVRMSDWRISIVVGLWNCHTGTYFRLKDSQWPHDCQYDCHIALSNCRSPPGIFSRKHTIPLFRQVIYASLRHSVLNFISMTLLGAWVSDNESFWMLFARTFMKLLAREQQ
jgi:hypothetical protein